MGAAAPSITESPMKVTCCVMTGPGVGRTVAVGTVVWAISSAARTVVYGGTTYYVDGNTYYKPCYQGDEVAYCVVENPKP